TGGGRTSRLRPARRAQVRQHALFGRSHLPTRSRRCDRCGGRLSEQKHARPDEIDGEERRVAHTARRNYEDRQGRQERPEDRHAEERCERQFERGGETDGGRFTTLASAERADSTIPPTL